MAGDQEGRRELGWPSIGASWAVAGAAVAIAFLLADNFLGGRAPSSLAGSHVYHVDHPAESIARWRMTDAEERSIVPDGRIDETPLAGAPGPVAQDPEVGVPGGAEAVLCEHHPPGANVSPQQRPAAG